jgi:type I restriction enzyme, S subunit
MTDAIDLTKEQRNTLSTLLRRFLPGVAVWAYGSRVKWTARPTSDLDLAAFTTPAQRPQVSELKDALAESNLPFPVDLHVWDEVPERFREIIRKEYVAVQEAQQPESGSGGLGMAGESPIEYDLRWPVVSLAEIAIKIGSGATPKGGADAYLPSRARFALVRSQNVFDRRFDYDGLAFISDEQADGLRGVILQPDDILLNITGDGITFGRACMVPKDVLPACVNQHVSIIRLDHQRADAGYVLSFLTHPDVKSYIESFNAGGSRRAVTKGHIESFRLPLPPLPEQRVIAHILGTLDDKIELNRRMNETLEAMARALFKSWFVDFDPVLAKAEGSDPGLPKPLADLFPDSFQDSELGNIPKGWRLAPLPEVIDVNPTRSLRKGVEAPYLDMANMPTQGHSPDDVVDRAFGSGMRFVNGDTLVARITPCLENGKTAFVDFLEAGEVGWGSTEYIVLRPKPPLPDEFAYCLARSAEFRDFAIQSMTGSSGRQRVPADSLSHFRVVAPPKSITESFGQLIKPLFARSSAASKEGRTLAALRDTLLPKLISGELRVKDAERILEIA